MCIRDRGTNGAGKTTTLRMMLNMLSRDSGEVLWEGKPLDTDTCNVGYLAEERGLYPKYPLMDQLIYFAGLKGVGPVNTDLFREIIREQIEAGKYLIMSSHQMATVEEFCTDIMILDHANAVLQGNLNEIKKQRGRENLYLKTEQDISRYIRYAGVRLVGENEFEYNL